MSLCVCVRVCVYVYYTTTSLERSEEKSRPGPPQAPGGPFFSLSISRSSKATVISTKLHVSWPDVVVVFLPWEDCVTELRVGFVDASKLELARSFGIVE